jgi:hypothetical protein
MSNTSARLARSVRILYVKAQRDSVMKALATETDPERQLKLQSKLDHYQTILASGTAIGPDWRRALH